MRIIARSKIVEYYTLRPDSRIALEDDTIGNQRFVFNIKGNHHRLIAVVKFTIKTVFIRFIGTHAEYDRIDAKNV